MFFNEEKFAARADELEQRRWQNMTSLGWFHSKKGELSADKVYREYPGEISGEMLPIGAEFNGIDQYLILQQAVQLPEKKNNCSVVGFFDFGRIGGGLFNGTFEALLFVNGHPFQGVDNNHREVLLDAYAGQTVELTFILWSGMERGGKPIVQRHLLSRADIGYLDTQMDELYFLVKALGESVSCLPEESIDRNHIIRMLNGALLRIDWDENLLRPSCTDALEYLNAELDACPEKNGETVHALGHTHIDVAWHWRLKHTREKAQRSFATVLRHMDNEPDYLFLQSQPQLYQYIKQDSPELYAEIKKRVTEGRWEADGGMWLEADCNLTSGESLVRQFLHGIRFFKEEFGVQCKYLWLPDVFGYSWALPQIMKLCGLDTFMTTKISWNQYNTIPNDLFWWRGIDGTDMLAYLIDVPDLGFGLTNRRSTYNGMVTPLTISGTWKRFKNKDLSNDVLIAYGHGDGGGGTTRDMIHMLRAINRVPGMPKVEMTSASKFFDKIHEHISNTNQYIGTWDGELYLEFHRGTYTSQAFNKKQNRKLEFALSELEWLDVLSQQTGSPGEKAKLQECWEILLREQFHDIIPGSSSHEVYLDSRKEYSRAWELYEQIRSSCLRAISQPANDVWTVYHVASVSGQELIRIPLDTPHGHFEDRTGAILPAQKCGDEWLVECQVDPLSASEVRFIRENAGLEAMSPFMLDLDARELETPHYHICWDQSGAITSLIDKDHQRNVLRGKGNILRIYEDKPLNYDAWDIDIFYNQKFEDLHAEIVECTELGNLRAKLRFRYRYRNSEILQDLVVYHNSRRIDFETQVDWHEDHRLLKTLFETDIRTTKATYDIQFGHVERPTHWNTSWDWARFEVCGQKWADLSDHSYGVSLLNDCKYGYHAKDNVLGLSLLKSAKYPDDAADMGHHTFVYSLFPHEGALGSVTIDESIRLNQPALVAAGAALASIDGLLQIKGIGVKLDAIKPAEDGNGVVIHLHEYLGGRADVCITSPRSISRFAPCNLLEEYDQPQIGKEITVGFSPFQIKAYRIWFA